MRKVSLEFADRLLKDAGSDPERWIERGFQLALARPPSKTEREACLAFVELQRTERQKRSPQAPADEIRRQALADLCQALFSLNEFLYID